MRRKRGDRGVGEDSGDPDAGTVTAEKKGEAEGAGPGIEVPVLAFKGASVLFRPGGEFTLKTGRYPVTAVDTIASCRNDQTHLSPDPNCTCGFYGMVNVADVPTHYGPVLLDVEFSGRVLIHQKGFRAQHQRILEIHCPGCWYCGAETVAFWLREGWSGGGGKSSPSWASVVWIPSGDWDVHGAVGDGE